ncbi:GerAB/ArcD/ProY family transporter [Candidatus Woesearchaeota archaeon]|jgi:tyrosine-specific transport protein|nr:GerAB/ArcD/ProY family transporter [Candidatus Woesearchaeota archaeon]MBT4322260.1 GerAB/ArcD/ProY family transporter [Candidatus Woesearchaeota archaeon]MBT4631280.1 GerAB/ArcD/ProY family transporter [Candidatus Woesearchaeota archaeon]
MDKNLFRASALLCGTIIGAGVLGIPYVIAQAGFLTGILTILILGTAILFLNLFLGEVILRTPGNHQIPGYAEKYLGKWGKRAMLLSMFAGIYGALIAYLIGEGVALSAIFGLSPMFFSIVFFIISSILVFMGLKTIIKYEMFFASLVLLLILAISSFSIFSGNFSLQNLSTFNLSNILLPYGVILFAFVGAAAIPEMKECITRDRKKLKKAILIGSTIPLLFYTIFAFAVVGVTGLGTTEVATIGLGAVLGGSMIVFGNLFAIFAMFTSFLTLALAMKEIYMYDYKIKPLYAWALTVFIPLIIFLFGAKSFILVIGITGAFAGGLDGILITLMFWRARKLGKRQPEYKLGKKHLIGFLLILIFIIGIIGEIFELI